jgi:two-component system, OmpR family, phosphate regulon response regulator PhoB
LGSRNIFIGVILARILVIDDEVDCCEYLSSVLKEERFVVETVQDPSQVPELLERFRPEALLVDYRLPGQSGLDLIKTLRRDPQWRGLGFIMVTGLAGEQDKIHALELGADDYVVKPFNPRELAARIRAVLRRRADLFAADKIAAPGIEIDLVAHKVLQDGNEVHLTLTEFRILTELIRNQGRVLSRDRLREVALENLAVTDRTIDVHMASLRKKLPTYQNSIQTVRGVGYRYAP